MKNKNINVIFKNRTLFFLLFIIVCFFIIIIRMSYLQLFNTKASIKNLNNLSIKKVYGPSMPRGRILDRNYNVIVDNVGTNLIIYKKDSKTTLNDEIKISYELAKNLSLDYENLKLYDLKKFWLIKNPKEGSKKITKKEKELYERRKIKARKIEKLKIDRVTSNELSKFNELDRKAAYIYYLMNNGYYYDSKTIKDDASSMEYAYVAQNLNKLKGVNISTSWKRVYPYGDTLRQILGNVSTSKNGIPKENRASYLNEGYKLNDRVGLSYLELQYEDEMRGKKDYYNIKNGKKKLIKEGSKGNDIVLSIDINLQKELENIIKEELLKAKNEPNTKFFDHTSVIITNPKTGEILAMASKQIINTSSGYKISDYTTNLLTGSDTPGSIVKGASMLTGYKTGMLNIGDAFYDKCIKFKNTQKKCSWSNSLGTLNDISALTYSSNSYQFQLALKIAGINYYYNMPVKVDDSAINTYREVFKELGLGVKSGIDLPFETEGYKGKNSNIGLLLNYSIGQYDTYSVMQLASYLNTLINSGERYKLNLVNEIRYSTKTNDLGPIKTKYERKLLNNSTIDKKYFERVKEGLKSVMQGSLGRGYMGDILNPAGKTGTSESFYDSNNDGIVDTETYSKSFIGYAPYDDAKMSIVSISPHVSYKNGNYTYTSNINKRIVSRICNIFFEIYK